jgi:hypothetical protein
MPARGGAELCSKVVRNICAISKSVNFFAIFSVGRNLKMVGRFTVELAKQVFLVKKLLKSSLKLPLQYFSEIEYIRPLLKTKLWPETCKARLHKLAHLRKM